MSTEPPIIELIVDMQKMYIDGAADDQLCSRGTEIYERIEKDLALAGKDAQKVAILEQERDMFDEIMGRIRRGRHAHALDAYDAYIARRPPRRKKKKRR